MTQQLGRTLLIKRGDGATPTEVFTTVCGFVARSFSVNNNEVDVTVPDCATPGNKVLAKTQYGIQMLEASGDGMFDSVTGHKDFANDALGQVGGNYQVTVPGWGTFEGAIMISSYELSGKSEGDMAFSASFKLNDHTFVAE